jgi:hypothetical protein
VLTRMVFNCVQELRGEVTRLASRDSLSLEMSLKSSQAQMNRLEDALRTIHPNNVSLK